MVKVSGICEKCGDVAESAYSWRCVGCCRCDSCETEEDLCHYVEGIYCSVCRAREVSRMVAEFDGDTKWEAEPVCPHCGDNVTEPYDLNDYDEIECARCEHPFETRRHVEIRYSTFKLCKRD